MSQSTHPSRREALASAAFAFALAAQRAAHAQTAPGAFPNRALKLTVSAAAGGSIDILARTLAPHLSASLGQPVVVENQGGGNGVVAINAVARAVPDGHALLVTGDAIVLAEALTPNAGYSARDSFAPVTLAISAAQILVTHPKSGIASVQNYIARVRASPGRVNLGIPSWGGIAHLISESMNQQLGGLAVEYISYRGGAPAVVDLLAGQLDALIITLPAITDHARDGRIVPLAVSTAQRDAALPLVPTMSETILPGFDVDSWQGFLAPAGTPPATITRLHAEITRALAIAEVRARLTELGFTIAAQPPEIFAQHIARATERFAAVIRAANISARGG
jgi:tripartite-type tricarboxylate transporter receptor subunit TctC